MTFVSSQYLMRIVCQGPNKMERWALDKDWRDTRDISSGWVAS